MGIIIFSDTASQTLKQASMSEQKAAEVLRGGTVIRKESNRTSYLKKYGDYDLIVSTVRLPNGNTLVTRATRKSNTRSLKVR